MLKKSSNRGGDIFVANLVYSPKLIIKETIKLQRLVNCLEDGGSGTIYLIQQIGSTSTKKSILEENSQIFMSGTKNELLVLKLGSNDHDGWAKAIPRK